MCYRLFVYAMPAIKFANYGPPLHPSLTCYVYTLCVDMGNDSGVGMNGDD